MRRLLSNTVIAFLALACLAATSARADDLAVCAARNIELAKQAEGYQGEARMKRLIEADLRRAGRELAEGDVEECLEALDHAAKLLSGQL